MNVMQVIAPAVTHPLAVWIVASCLFAWAAWSAAGLARGTRRVAQLLDAARARIATASDAAAFAAGFDAISDALAQTPLIGARWQDYRASLVLPATPGRPVRATARGAAWFDVGGLLRAVGVDSRYHAALPNLLVGAGLLFTFLGLAAALGSAGGIVSAGADSGARNEALRALLDTASFKFITSLVGLLLSIVYALFRKRRLQTVESALDRFLAALEARVPLLTPASLQQEANALLERQAVASGELAASIGSALDRALDRRLGQHLAPLAAASGGGADDRMLRVAESLAALGTRLEGLQSGMARSADAMATRVGDGAEASLRAVAATLTAAAQRLEKQMGQEAAASSARLAGQFEAMLGELRALAESSRATGAATFGALAEKIGASATAFEASAARVAGMLASAADSTGGALGRGAEDAVRRIAEATEGMRAAMQAMLGEFHGALGAAGATVRENGDVLRQSVDTAGTTLAAAVAGAAAQLDGTARNLASVSGGLATQVGSVNDAATKIAARFADLDRAAREAASPLAQSAADLKAAGTAAAAAIEPLRAVADGLRTGFAQMGSAAQSIDAAHAGAGKLTEALTLASARFENLDREMADTVQALQDGLRGFTRQVRDFVVETDENLARSATQLGNLAKDLEATIGDFLDQVKRRSA
jgi:hypothetical protein